MTPRSSADTAMADALRRAVAVPEADLVRLHDTLVATAEHEDLADVTYRVVDSPLGPLLLAATPIGLRRIAFASEGFDAVLSEVAASVSPRVLADGRRTDDVARQLDEYFAGRRARFEVALDLAAVSPFRRAVLDHLLAIPFGGTESYATVAAAAGSPAAVRAAGSACAHNPVPIVVPCHRVVRADGSVGGYLGGPEAKRALLELEATS